MSCCFFFTSQIIVHIRMSKGFIFTSQISTPIFVAIEGTVKDFKYIWSFFPPLQLLVDFAFNWSETWVQNWEESDGQGWYFALLGSTLGMIVLSIVMTVLMYTYFIGHGACSLSVFFITTNILLCAAVCGMFYYTSR